MVAVGDENDDETPVCVDRDVNSSNGIRSNGGKRDVVKRPDNTGQEGDGRNNENGSSSGGSMYNISTTSGTGGSSSLYGSGIPSSYQFSQSEIAEVGNSVPPPPPPPPIPHPNSADSAASSISDGGGQSPRLTGDGCVMGTIEFDARQGGGDGGTVGGPHNFLPPNQFYDSDGSDGSIVFAYPRGGTPPASYDLPNAIVRGRLGSHERFPSFGSTSSLVRVPVMSSGGRDTPPPPPPPLTSSSSATGGGNQYPYSAGYNSNINNRPAVQNSNFGTAANYTNTNNLSPSMPPANTPARLLPYHQRRKLSLQRQQQEEQQGDNGGNSSSAKSAAGGGAAKVYGSLNSITTQGHSAIPPSFTAASNSAPRTQSQQQTAATTTPATNAQKQTTSAAPTFRSMRPSKLNTISSPPPQPIPALTPKPKLPSASQQPPTGPPGPPSSAYRPVDRKASAALPPSGQHYRSFSGGVPNNKMANTAGRARASSTDSLQSSPEKDAPPRHQPPLAPQPNRFIRPGSTVSGQQRQQQPWGGAGHGHAIHVQNDSTGSISSLGSTTGGPGSKGPGGFLSLTDRLGKDIAGFLREQTDDDGKNPPHRKTGSGFLGGMFSHLSPRTTSSDIEEERKEYHQKNQAFLHKAERERAKLNKTIRELSPQRRTIRSASPRPPNTRGAHRPGLASIDNDNWEEDDEDVTPASHKGRTFKHSNKFGRGGSSSALNKSGRSKENGRGATGAYPNAYGIGNTGGGGDGDNIQFGHSQLTAENSVASFSGKSSSSSRRGKISKRKSRRSRRVESSSSSESSYTSGDFTSDEESDNELSSSFLDDTSGPDMIGDEPDEKTSLLPPSGISTHERRDGKSHADSYGIAPDSPSKRTRRDHGRSSSRMTSPPGDREDSRRSRKKSKRRERRHDERISSESRRRHEEKKRSKKHKSERKKYRKRKGKKDSHNHETRSRRDRHRHISPSSDSSDESDLSSSSTTSSSFDYKRWAKKKALLLEKERAKLIAQWKEEAKAEAEKARKEAEERRLCNRFGRLMQSVIAALSGRVGKFLASAEMFICNLPLTIGAVALAIVTLGVVWFKFAEENLDSCQPVHFHSAQCSFPEFPGCFYCDTSARMYKLAVDFHFSCSATAGVLAMSFVAKVLLARRVVIDEMSSPTTSSPAGLLCMTTVCVFAGRGWIGQFLVSLAASVHLCLAAWFIYMALAYHILPEPSWYPNTVGIGLSAVKTWLYYPMPGHFLMAISLSLNFFFFPISLIRVTLNKKISAPVCWIQMSAPSISLYALTIMAQPSFEEEHPDVTQFQRVHRMVYLPCMHFLFVLSCIGFCSSVQSLWARWDTFSRKEFSPAHAAFCFPTLAHANAIQAYRGAVDAFSNIKPGSPFKIVLYTYWVIILVSGTIATLVITARFFYCLPSWTQVDISGEEEPPAPNETVMKDVITTGETMRQPFVSPAVLQANETGALIMLPGREDGRRRYVRTRKVTALGFEPMMDMIEMNTERDVLLDWVAKNPPRRRKRTLSVPGIDFNYGYGDFGTGNSGVFDVESANWRGIPLGHSRARAQTSDATYGALGGGRPLGR